MNKIQLYTVSDEYIVFLRNTPDKKLINVFKNDDDDYKFSKKYLGLLLRLKLSNMIPVPDYLKEVVDFKIAEERCKEYVELNSNDIFL